MNKKFVNLLRLFKNKPYHLAKFLIENDAINNDFFEKIQKSEKLQDCDDIENINFNDINEMNNYYLSIIDMNSYDGKTKEDLEKELNEKLDHFIKSEEYESAAYLRDYMKIKKIKRISKFK